MYLNNAVLKFIQKYMIKIHACILTLLRICIQSFKEINLGIFPFHKRKYFFFVVEDVEKEVLDKFR